MRASKTSIDSRETVEPCRGICEHCGHGYYDWVCDCDGSRGFKNRRQRALYDMAFKRRFDSLLRRLKPRKVK